MEVGFGGETFLLVHFDRECFVNGLTVRMADWTSLTEGSDSVRYQMKSRVGTATAGWKHLVVSLRKPGRIQSSQNPY